MCVLGKASNMFLNNGLSKIVSAWTSLGKSTWLLPWKSTHTSNIHDNVRPVLYSISRWGSGILLNWSGCFPQMFNFIRVVSILAKQARWSRCYSLKEVYLPPTRLCTTWWFQIFCFLPLLGNWLYLTNIFHIMGWNHQLGVAYAMNGRHNLEIHHKFSTHQSS